MAAGIGATLPLQTAPPAVDGEAVDPAASQPFLAALAAAVATAVTPPPPPVAETPVVAGDATAAEDGEPTVGADTAAATKGALLTLVTPRGDAGPKGITRTAAEPNRIDADATNEVTEPGSDPDASEGPRLRVLLADRAAPRAADARATPVPPVTAAPSSPTTNAAPPVGDASDADAADEDVSHGNALGVTNRAEPATPASQDLPQGAVPATPSWHAAMQALAATSRAAAPDTTPAPEAPLAVPMPQTTGSAGELGRPSAVASSTAAGVLAAMHAAHLAHDTAEPLTAPVARFADAVVATLVKGGTAAPSTADVEGTAPDAVVAVSEAGEPTPLPTPLRVMVPARPAASPGEQETAHDDREDAPGQERRTLTPAATGTTEAPVSTGRAPWMTAEAPTMPSAAEGGKPAVAVHRTADPAATPPSPTSQVTVELDAERTGAQRVRVAVRGDVVHATVVTDRGGAAAMRPQLDDLRHALEGQGFREAHVQLRVAGDGSSAVSAGGAPEARLRMEASSRAPDGSGTEQQPRGRQRGEDHQPPPGGQPEFEEELL